jgi:tetratricopeptide (TPR) repeat protein
MKNALRACSKSGILALQTPKFYLAGSKRARKSGFMRSIDRINPQFEQALRVLSICCLVCAASGCRAKNPPPETAPVEMPEEALSETISPNPAEGAQSIPEIAGSAAASFSYQPQRSLNDFSGALPAFGVRISEINPVNYQNADPAVLRQMGMEQYLISFLSGEQLYRSGDYDRAIAEYARSVSLKADFAEALISLGNARLKKGDARRAIEEYTRAIKIANSRAEVYNYRGYAWAERGETDRAIEDYSRAITLKADYADALINRAHAFYEKGDWDRVIEDCTRLLKLEPGNATIWNRRGSAWYHKEDDDRAIADFSEAIKQRPHYALAWHNRGNAWFNKGDYDNALADLNRALSLDPVFTGAYRSRGNILRLLGNEASAAADFAEAERIKIR